MATPSHTWFGDGFVQSLHARSPGYFLTWFVSSALGLGLTAFWMEQDWLLPWFFALGYGVLVHVFVKTMVVWRDFMNPLCLVLVIATVRFFISGLMIFFDAEPPEHVVNFYDFMQLTDYDWLWGHALALIGMLCTALGWLSFQSQFTALAPLKFRIAEGIKYAALAGMLVGFAALAAFFLMNASLGAILSGSFRGTIIQVGSGKFFILAHLLIVGSVYLCCYSFGNGVVWWRSLIPVVVAMIAYWPLGGRGRALIPVFMGVILLWYVNREQGGWKRISLKVSNLFRLLILALFIILVSYLGSYYRGQAEQSESVSVAGLSEYLKVAIYTDLGQLHSLAGAIAIGPGVLGGQTFWGALSWPLPAFLPIPGRSAGVYIVDMLAGQPDDYKWGVNATLIGDAYLNFGLFGVAVVMTIYGVILKAIYLKFRQGKLHSAVYVLGMVYGTQMLWATIQVWPQAFHLLAFAFVITLLGKTVFNLRPSNPRLGFASNGKHLS